MATVGGIPGVGDNIDNATNTGTRITLTSKAGHTVEVRYGYLNGSIRFWIRLNRKSKDQNFCVAYKNQGTTGVAAAGTKYNCGDTGSASAPVQAWTNSLGSTGRLTLTITDKSGTINNAISNYAL